MIADQQEDPRSPAGPFWFYDRDQRMLVGPDGKSGIYLPHCDNSANILSVLVSFDLTGDSMPAGAYEDLLRAFTEIFGEKVMDALQIAGEGTIVDLRDELGVRDFEAYLDTVQVPESRLR